MNKLSKIALTVAGLVLSCQVAAQVTLYEQEGYQGQSVTTTRPINNLERFGFNDRASSIVLRGNRSDRWEVCDDVRFAGRCVILRRGEYPSLTAIGLDDRITSVRSVNRNARNDDDRSTPPPPVQISQVVFYENEGFDGRSFTANGAVADFRGSGFNDRASSAVVRGERWEVCDDVGYGGRCVVLRPGQYASLSAMGLNDRVSSVRDVGGNARVDDGRYAPPPMAVYDYGRRNDERIYEANITSVRAVVEDSGQRCWVEPQQVMQEQRGSANVPGALLGAVIGGVLGHQVGGGTGRDVATGLGVVAGAAIGGNSGRNSGGQSVTTQNVQRCTNNPERARPAYWDVTYNFRGVEHRVQMTRPPGATVTVNEKGEPRA